MSNNCFGNYTTTGAAGPSVCNPAPVCCTPAEPPELEAENESTATASPPRSSCFAAETCPR